MHPILSDRKRTAVYLIIWGIIGVLSGFVLHSITETDILYTLLFSFPLMMVYAEMNLSAWYVCRAFPLDKTSLWRVLLVVFASVIFISTVWTLFAWLWMYLTEQITAIALFHYPLYQVLLSIFFFYANERRLGRGLN